MGPDTTTRLDRADLARNLKRLRDKRGWSQEELAGEAGDLRQAAVSEIETGRANPTLDTLERLATALGVRVRDLFKPPRARRRSAPRG